MVHPKDAPLKGAVWKIVSLTAFAAVNAIVKQLSGGGMPLDSAPLSIPVLVFYENLLGTLVFLPIFLKHKGPLVPRQHFTLHFCRIVFALMGIVFWFTSLKYLPISQAVALQFMGPIFTVMGAWLFLNEKITRLRFLAIFASFVGALVIMNPVHAFTDLRLSWPVFLPLLAALSFTIDKLLNRKLCLLGESTSLLTFYLMLFMIPLSLFLALGFWQWPTRETLPWLLLLGCSVALANYGLIKAFELAEITLLTPIGFFKFIINTLVAYLFFQEVSTSLPLWGGTLLILVSVFLLTDLKIRSSFQRTA